MITRRTSLLWQFCFFDSPPCSPRRHNSTKTSEPLRILFCGSDEFSIASLRALNVLRVTSPDLINSIDVVCRPEKPVGRGLKATREGITSLQGGMEHPAHFLPVPIASTARELSLNLHSVDTFTKWTVREITAPCEIFKLIAESRRTRKGNRSI